MDQNIAVTFLKKKGTGKTMGKHLEPSELAQCNALFQSKDVHLTTKATLLTAFLMLENTDEEAQWLDTAISNKNTIFPTDLQALISTQTNTSRLLELGKTVIQETDLSKDDMKEGITAVFSPQTAEWEKAVFLEAQRLKRETLDENIATLDYYWEHSQHFACNTPILIDMATPYDGMNRHPNLSLFTAVLLASIGVPCYCHGIKEVSPKYGVTPHKLLLAAGKNPLQDPETTVAQIENPKIGWGYIDQEHSFPEAAALVALRKNMVKRPILATIEKLCQPIRCATGNYIVTGYTHPPYKQKSIDLCQHGNRSTGFLIVRGIEGSTQLPLDKRARVITAKDPNIPIESFIEPESIGFKYNNTENDPDINTDYTLNYGLNCLSNDIPFEHNPCAYNAMILLEHFGIMPTTQSKPLLEQSLQTKNAIQHWINGQIN